MKLILTRHGQTIDNASGITMGHRNSPLTAKGRRQAEIKADILKIKYPNIKYIYTSDLGRCVETANVIAKNLKGSKIIKYEGLREVSFGIYEGMQYATIPNRPEGYFTDAFPGGESNKDMAMRVISLINSIYDNNRNQAAILVVSHSGPIAAIMASYHREKLQAHIDNKIDNTEIYEIDLLHKLKLSTTF